MRANSARFEKEREFEELGIVWPLTQTSTNWEGRLVNGIAKNVETGSKMATKREGGWRRMDEKNGDITWLAAKRRIKQAVMIAGVL